jgi:hypothetical protein
VVPYTDESVLGNPTITAEHAELAEKNLPGDSVE